ncbi:MAG: HupE/UreJ family protein [Hyphomonadaceae bacterium]
MWFENVGAFIDFGFQHIIPDGLDHVLFVVALYLNARNWGSLLLQVTTFTLAHTVTLALAATSVVSVDPAIVEPLIALSIVVLA